jgi:hypothetical protein
MDFPAHYFATVNIFNHIKIILTLQAKMHELGVISSRSRPRVSNDNPCSESLFRTLKYCPRWPSEGFKFLEGARQWVKGFVYFLLAGLSSSWGHHYLSVVLILFFYISPPIHFAPIVQLPALLIH